MMTYHLLLLPLRRPSVVQNPHLGHVIYDEMTYMYHKGAWYLVELLDGCKPIGCK